MKILILSLCIFIGMNGYTQKYDSWQKRDTTKQRSSLSDSLSGNSEIKIISGKQDEKKTDTYPLSHLEMTHTNHNIWELVTFAKNGFKPSVYKTTNPKPPRPFRGHWSGIYYGFINIGNSDYSMYPEGTPEFMELDWGGSFALQFNLFKHSINLSPRNNFGLVMGVGLDYQRMRFANKSQSITMIDGKVSPLSLESLGIHDIKRSTFKTLYLTIPLLLEVQFPARYRRNLYVSGGVVGGIRMHSKTKVVYYDGGKEKRKEKDSFNMIPFKADVTGRIGYNHITVWGSYTLTNLFKSGKGPELHPYTVGIGLAFGDNW